MFAFYIVLSRADVHFSTEVMFWLGIGTLLAILSMVGLCRRQ
jgi:hypothetical protein